jgi:hypothetical protein
MLGGAVGPVVFSQVVTRFGYRPAWVGLAVLTAIGAAMSAYAARSLATALAHDDDMARHNAEAA